MTSIREFLSKDPLGAAEFELMRRESLRHFSKYLPETADAVWPRALSPFVDKTPLTYWDPEVVRNALSILEESANRTTAAIAAFSRQIGIGFDNLLKTAPASHYENHLSENSGSDILRLTTELHPEYLRCAQHIFANLITPYWAVLKKGEVHGKFNVPGAIQLFKANGLYFLSSGYENRIRNAIAHGEVVFTGHGIQYGPQKYTYMLPADEFLAKSDLLVRTSNALAIALLLFIARNKAALFRTQKRRLPTSIIALLAAASVERCGLKIFGAVESGFNTENKNLYISVKTPFKSREIALLDCARIAMYLIENGASDYSGYLFEIDQSTNVRSLVIILPERLEKLLQENASADCIEDIYAEKQILLWCHEGILRTRLRALRLSFRSHLRLALEGIRDERRKIGLWQGAGRYRIKDIENASAGGVARVRVKAILRSPSDVNDKEMIKEIIYAVTKEVSKKWIKTNASEFERCWIPYRRPKYIWIWLYKLDGTLRWLSLGEQNGNLIAVAEKNYGYWRPPILIHNPQEIWKGIRIRYAIDSQDDMVEEKK